MQRVRALVCWLLLLWVGLLHTVGAYLHAHWDETGLLALSMLLLVCFLTFVVGVTHRLFNVQDFAPLEQLLYCPMFEVLHRSSSAF